MRKVITAILAALALAAARCPASAQESSDWASMSNYLHQLGISREDADRVKDAIDNRAFPTVDKVEISPASPRENEPVTVSAVIEKARKRETAEVWEAFINYTADGGASFSRIRMERTSSSGDVWKGVIPGQPSGTEIMFGIHAVNAFDEAYVENFCAVEVVVGAMSKEADCRADTLDCPALRPSGCLFPMSIPHNRLDGAAFEYSGAPESLFIRSSRVGFSQDRVLMTVNTQGRVSPGRLSPTAANIYVAGWLNPDISSGDTGMEAILRQGAVVIYAPLNISNKCALYYFHGSEVVADNKSAVCAADENRLAISVDRKAFKDNPSRTLEFMFMTFVMTQINPADVELADISLITRVAYRKRGYRVE